MKKCILRGRVQHLFTDFKLIWFRKKYPFRGYLRLPWFDDQHRQAVGILLKVIFVFFLRCFSFRCFHLQLEQLSGRAAAERKEMEERHTLVQSKVRFLF